MNHNQLPWCKCHQIEKLHYFFRETSPSIKTGRTRKQLITACHECGTPGNQAVKKTPEMQKEWLNSLPVLNMHEYNDYRYWNYQEPRPYPMGNQLNQPPIDTKLKERIFEARKTRWDGVPVERI